VVIIAFLSHLTIQLHPQFSVLCGAVANNIKLVFQTKGQKRPTTLIIIAMSMQTKVIALDQGILITTKQLSSDKAYTWIVG
ncbi:iron ABC transporter permease, partial [Staphylococcus aureus]|nr:iron ABC transporter permease [Staphylococcus aureus]